MTEEQRDLIDRMATYIKYHDIKSLMELVMEAINAVQGGNTDGSNNQ